MEASSEDLHDYRKKHREAYLQRVGAQKNNEAKNREPEPPTGAEINNTAETIPEIIHNPPLISQDEIFARQLYEEQLMTDSAHFLPDSVRAPDQSYSEQLIGGMNNFSTTVPASPPPVIPLPDSPQAENEEEGLMSVVTSLISGPVNSLFGGGLFGGEDNTTADGSTREESLGDGEVARRLHARSLNYPESSPQTLSRRRVTCSGGEEEINISSSVHRGIRTRDPSRVRTPSPEHVVTIDDEESYDPPVPLHTSEPLGDDPDEAMLQAAIAQSLVDM